MESASFGGQDNSAHCSLQLKMKKFCLIPVLLAASFCAAAQTRSAVVTISVSNMRSQPDYESSLENQVLMGRVVDVTDSVGYWRKVSARSPEYTGWINVLALAPVADVLHYEAAPKYLCTADFSYVYSRPSLRSSRICDLVQGDILIVGPERSRRGFSSVCLPSGKLGWVRSSDLEFKERYFSCVTPTAEGIIATAMRYVGVPYLWGGNSPKGFDCSGLVGHAYYMNGIQLPRNASQQVKLGDEIDISGVSAGDFSAFEPGDLMFFGNKETGRVTHVALYIGDGHIIHASQLVRVNSLVPGAENYYENSHRLLYCRRILGSSMPIEKK